MMLKHGVFITMRLWTLIILNVYGNLMYIIITTNIISINAGFQDIKITFFSDIYLGRMQTIHKINILRLLSNHML